MKFIYKIRRNGHRGYSHNRNHNHNLFILFFIVTSYFLLPTSHLSYAGGMIYWTPNGVLISENSGAAGLVDDMKGGALAFGVYAESIIVVRIDRNGNLPWGLHGRAIASYAGYQGSLVGVSDNCGGAISVWCKNLPRQLYCQRVDSLGNRMWGNDAQRVTLSDSAQWWPTIVSDGAKGAIISWQEIRVQSQGLDIYAQRIDSSGVRRWGDYGVAVCAMDSGQGAPTATSDNAGNCVIAWVDSRDGEYDIYAQRLNINGQALWQANGIPVCDTNGAQTFSWGGPLYGSQITIATDTTIIVNWIDQRNGNCDIYAQNLNLNGLPLWVSQGVAVCDTINSQRGGILIADSKGGAIFCWVDERNGFKNIYTQRLNSNGQKLWANQGVPITTTDSAYWYQKIVSDGKSGAIICWQDRRSGNYDIYAQHVDSLGNILWDTNGMPVCTAVNNQQYQEMIASDSGRAIICWTDYRSGSARGYAQKVGDEIIGIDEKMHDTGYRMQDVKLEIYPNPFREKTEIRYTMHDSIYRTYIFSLKIYDVSGRLVKSFKHVAGYQAFANEIVWDGADDFSHRLAAGVYFIKFDGDGFSRIEKVVKLE